MKKENKTLRFKLEMENEAGYFQIVYENGWWKGTPGTNGKETAKMAIKFLQQYL